MTNGNTEDGLLVDGGSSNTIDANRGQLNGDDGLEARGGTGNVVRRNIVNDNGDFGICVTAGNIDGGKNQATGNGGSNISFARL